jgi:hypothetical protein
MANWLYESEQPLYGGTTLTVGAVKKALQNLPDDALFYTSTNQDTSPWETKIIVIEPTE